MTYDKKLASPTLKEREIEAYNPVLSFSVPSFPKRKFCVYPLPSLQPTAQENEVRFPDGLGGTNSTGVRSLARVHREEQARSQAWRLIPQQTLALGPVPRPRSTDIMQPHAQTQHS